MTVNHIAASRRRGFAPATLLVAATAAALLVGGLHYASPAHADAIGIENAKTAQYNACVSTAQSISTPGYSLAEIQVSCCHSYGGTVYSDGRGNLACVFPTSYGQTTPPPGGTTVILPPDAGQTQLGPTQPPPPTAILHPGSNTRAGIQ